MLLVLHIMKIMNYLPNGILVKVICCSFNSLSWFYLFWR